MTVGELRKRLKGLKPDVIVTVQVQIDEPEDWDGSLVSSHFEKKCEFLKEDTLFLCSACD